MTSDECDRGSSSPVPYPTPQRRRRLSPEAELQNPKAAFGSFAEKCQTTYKIYAEKATLETFDSFTALFLILFGVVIILPTALSFWMVFHIFEKDGDVISPVRWLVSIALPAYVSIWGLKHKSLSYSGAFSAYIVGFLMTMASYVFSACLLTFFVVCSKATKVKAETKRRIDADYVEGGQRTLVQVVCNGGIAALFAVLYILEAGCREVPIDFGTGYYESSYALAVLGALSCSCGDTLASELGSVLSSMNPRLITTFREVPRGTNGGVSRTGLAASFVGGLIVGAMFYVMTMLFVTGHALGSSPPQWPCIMLGGVYGFCGSVIDSYLGAMLQYSGLDKNNRVVNYSGKDIMKICGLDVLDNHSVNFISSAAAALLAPKIGLLFMRWLH